MSHFWYKNLDGIVQATRSKNYSQQSSAMTSIVETLFRLCLDQLLFSPLLNTVFYSLMTLWNEKSLRNAPNVVRTNLLPTMLRSWRVWPLAQVVNLSVVPPELRVLFANMIGFGWSIYLSWFFAKQAKK